MVLSRREAEVLAAVARHRTNAEIAAELVLSVRTVESHVSSLLRKLGASDRRELAVLARATPAPVAAPAELVGRAEELARLEGLLAEPGLVTVVGPGGIGKTSLVRALGAVAFADLTTLPPGAGPELVVATCLRELLPLPPDAGSDRDALVAEVLRRDVPLVLDNCEHLLDGVAAVAADVVRRGVRVLATSRERLAVAGERILPLGPLDGEAALAVFERRAAALEPPVVLDDEQRVDAAATCAAVECVPLAVELAAARLGQLSPRDLRAAVAAGIDVLEGGDRGEARHRSVRAMLGWSDALLAEEDRRVHRWVSVLQGPFRVATAGAVTGRGGTVGAALARLVEASLLVRVGADRYRQLALVRADAAERLAAAGEREQAVAGLLGWAEEAIATPDADDDPDLRAAAVEAARRGDEPSLQLLRRLAQGWQARSAWEDAVDAWERAASVSRDPADALAAAELAWMRWHGDEAWRLFGLAATLAEDHGDPRALVRARESQVELATRFDSTMSRVPPLGDLQDLVGRARRVDTEGDLASESLLASAEAWVLSAAGDQTGSREVALQAEAVAVAADDADLQSAALDAQSASAGSEGDAAAIAAIAERRLALRDRLGGTPRSEIELSDVLAMAIDGAVAVGRFALGLERARELLARESGRGLAHVGLGRMLICEFFLGRFTDSVAHAEELLRRWESAGGGPAGYLLTPLSTCVAVSGYRRDEPAEARWRDALDRVSSHGGVHGRPLLWSLEADVHLFHGRRERAADAVAVSPWDVGGFYRSFYAATRAEVLGGQALVDAGRLVHGNAYAAAVLARARGDLDAALEGFERCGAAFQTARTRLALRPGDAREQAALRGMLSGG